MRNNKKIRLFSLRRFFRSFKLYTNLNKDKFFDLFANENYIAATFVCHSILE